MMIITKFVWGFVVLLMGATMGCEGNDLSIQTYQEPKREPMSASSPAAAQHDRGLKWTLPEGWHEGPSASAMRLASFIVSGADGSIVVLSGDGGGMVANVNRWRGQVGLSPLGADQIEQQAMKDKGALGAFRWFSLINKDNPKQAMLVAIIPRSTQTIYVKLVGSESVLKNNQKKFLNLCRSIQSTGESK
jgi:hypothetical protein